MDKVDNTTSTNGEIRLTTDDANKLLQAYNMQQAFKFLPVFCFLIVIMMAGTFGNLLVLYVYGKRFKKTSSNYFIVSMAAFDLLACLVGLPTEMYDLFHSYTFFSASMCKVLRYTEAVTVYGSAIILVEIAIDRYFKICRPLMLIELYKIRMLCAGAGVAALLLSVPTLVLFGISNTPTPSLLITGHDCSIEEQYRKKTFAYVYYYLLGTVFVLTLVLLSLLYIRIWIEIRRRKHLVIGDFAQSSLKLDTSVSLAGRKIRQPRRKILSSSSSSEETVRPNGRRSLNIRPRLESIAEAVNRFKVTRTTLVLFAVTVAFVISYLPGIVIMILRSAIKDLEQRQSETEEIISKLFSKFFFLNNAINPVIYSFLNINFRRKCFKLLQSLFTCTKKESVSTPEKNDSQKSNKLIKHEMT